MAMRILMIDDDPTFCRTLTRALARRGLETAVAHEPVTALAEAERWQPSHALLDLNLGTDISGLELIEPLLAAAPGLRLVVLTGYASIATTVTAIKRGAADYLAKPTDANAVLEVLGGMPEACEPEPFNPMSLKRLEWEHIQRVLAEHDGNISAAARALGMYRRTLQRKLDKRPVKESN